MKIVILSVVAVVLAMFSIGVGQFGYGGNSGASTMAGFCVALAALACAFYAGRGAA